LEITVPVADWVMVYDEIAEPPLFGSVHVTVVVSPLVEGVLTAGAPGTVSAVA